MDSGLSASEVRMVVSVCCVRLKGQNEKKDIGVLFLMVCVVTKKPKKFVLATKTQLCQLVRS